MSVKPNLWGEAWAATAGPTKVKGTADRWKDGDKTILMIKWDGYQTCKQQFLIALENDEHGASLDLELLPFSDGTIPTKQAAAPPPPPPPPPEAPRQAAAGGGQQQGAQAQAQRPDVDRHGQKWRHRHPTFVKEDARTADHSKPRFNSGGLHLPSMMSIFLLLLPPKWITDIIKYTNPYLDDSDPVNKKLTKGELLASCCASSAT